MTADIIKHPRSASPDPISEIQRARVKEWADTDRLIQELQRYAAANGWLIQCANLSELRGDVQTRINLLKGEHDD